MRWPWAKRGEQRAYSDTVVNALLAAAAGGGTADAAATGAVQSSCGFWSRAMAAATVSPATGTAAIVTPDVLYDIGRDLILHGQYLAQFVVDEQGPRLVRPADHDVAGGADPASWTYKLMFSGPSRQTTGRGSRSDVIHITINAAASSPWRGVSPVVAAASTAGTLAGIEKQLAAESSHQSGYVIPTAGLESLDPGSFAQLVADMSGIKGATRLVPSLGARPGDPQSRPGDRDWSPVRLGANPPSSIVDLRSAAGLSVLSACGIPLALASQGTDATAMRESLRQFLYTSVLPISRIVQAELARVLEIPLVLDFSALNASDVMGRSRAFASLIGTNEGIPVAEARRLTGLQ